jgi:hypothetical protein
MRDRRSLWIGLGVLVLVVIFGCAYYRKRRLNQVPQWLNPGMNADGISSELATLTPAESLAANGCVPMAACCGDRSARREIMRTYPASLTDSPNSLIGLRFGIGG